MKLTKILLLTFLLSGLCANSAFAQREVIYKKDIIAAGILRPAEVFTLSDLLYTITIDGLTWQVNSGAGNLYQTQNLQILVNHQPLEIAVEGNYDLYLLPFDVINIDSVEIFHSPGVYAQQFNRNVMVHFHLEKPKKGVSGMWANWFGNETGDPGPYLFTPLRTLNVDRIGPDDLFQLSLSTGDHFVETRFLNRNHYASDPIIRARNRFLKNDQFLTQTGTWMTNFGTKIGNSKHFGDIGYATNGDIWWTDLVGAAATILPPYPQEVFAENRLFFTRLNGELNLNNTSKVNYAWHYSRRELLTNPEAVRPVALFGESNRHRFAIGYKRKSPKYSFFSNAEIVQQKLETFENSKPLPTVFRLQNNLAFKLSQRMEASTSLTIDYAASDVAVQVAQNISYEIDNFQKLYFSTSFVQQLPIVNQQSGFWQSQNLQIINNNLAEYTFLQNFQTVTFLKNDVEYKRQFNKRIQLNAGVSAQVWRDVAIPTNIITYSENASKYMTNSSSISNYNGQQFSGFGSLNFKHHSFTHHLAFRGQMYRGVTTFRQYGQSIPSRIFQWRLRWLPVKNFGLWMGLTHRSKTYWTDYVNIENTSEVVPASWAVNLSGQKWLWQRRGRFEFIVRNLFNERLRYHPIGAQFDFQFYVRFSLQIQGLFSNKK